MTSSIELTVAEWSLQSTHYGDQKRYNKTRKLRSGRDVEIRFKSILAGTFIVATANMMIAKLNNDQVASLLFQVSRTCVIPMNLIAALFQALEDMVKGELMQVGINREDCAGFSDYLNKTYFKTGSLIANGCHAVIVDRKKNIRSLVQFTTTSIFQVSVFAGAGPNLQRTAFRFGRETGMGFQLVDDLLDYTMTAADLGKPVTADLRLGLATAPALFAAEQVRRRCWLPWPRKWCP